MHVEFKTSGIPEITQTNILGINNNEVRFMQEMNNRVKEVLFSHKVPQGKKLYLTDDDLLGITAILSTLTKGCKFNEKNEFADAKTALGKELLDILEDATDEEI